MTLGNSLGSSLVSIASTIDHCHVPGRTEHAMLASNEIELGTGPHNEPGYRKLSPVPAPEEFIALNLKYMLDEGDPERSYVKRQPDDEIVLMVSNFGGMSNLEQGALTDELLTQLERDYNIIPIRAYTGFIETSLNAPAFSTSILNLTNAQREGTRFSIDEMIKWLDVRTTTQWEGMSGRQTTRIKREQQFIKKGAVEEPRAIDPGKDVKLDPVLLEKALRKAGENVIAAEPDLTKWDTVMGDGDCGETLKTGASAMLAALDSGLAKQGSAVAVLHELEHVVESKMGGTLGGILGIFVVSMTTALQNGVASGKSGIPLWGHAVSTALGNLQRYTPAKVNDRTVMDALIPFANGLQEKGSLQGAVEEAVKGAESTRKMKPKLGRATYVGIDEGQDLPPDPGAMGIMETLRGLLEGSQ